MFNPTMYEPCPVCNGNAEHCDCDDMTVRKTASICLGRLAIASILSIVVATPAMANRFAADVTEAKTAPHLAARKACPKAVKGVPARGYRAAIAQCRKQQSTTRFIPDPSKPPVVSTGTGVR
jgi:hypothetical protein